MITNPEKPNHNQTSPQKTREWLKQLQSYIWLGFSVLTKLGIAIIIVFASVVVYQEIYDEDYTLEAFSVPSSLEEQGFNGSELVRITLDEMQRIETVAKTAKDLQGFRFGNSSEDFQVEVLGMGVPINSIKKYIKGTLGIEYKSIGASIKEEGDSLSLTLRMKPGGTYKFFANSKALPLHAAIEKLIQKTAIQLVKQQEPVILTYYLGRTGKYNEGIEVANYTIKNRPQDATWSYNVWGIILRRQGKREEAIAKFKKAIEINRNYYSAWTNWGYVLLLQKKYEESIGKYEKALEIKPNNPAALNNLGYCYELMGEYDKAIVYARKALAINAEFGMAYSTLAEVYGLRNDLPRFYKNADSAMKYNYPIWKYLADEPYASHKNDSIFMQIIQKYQPEFQIPPPSTPLSPSEPSTQQ